MNFNLNALSTFIVFSLLFSALTDSNARADQKIPMGLSVEQLVLMVKGAVIEEVNLFNNGVAGGEDLTAYRSRLTDYFKASGKSSIDPEYVSDKCAFSENNLSAFFSNELSAGDDALSERKNALSAVKSIHGPKIWKLISSICVHARARFITRLKSATMNGAPLSFNDEMVEGTARLLFFPTDHGKPSFTKSVDSAFNVILSGAMFLGAGSALIGIPVGGISLVVITLAMGGRSTGSLIAGHGHPFLLKLKRYDSTDLIQTQIDLTGTELRLIAISGHP